MPTVLLFDLGGVLIENTMFSELKRLMVSEKSESELVELWLRNPVAREFELGRCSMQTFSRSIVEEFSLPLDPDTFLAEFRNWPKGFHPGVESMLIELQQNNSVCCLSNSNEAHWKDSITDHFNYAFSSHLIGCIKPDAEAFEHVLSEIDVEAKSVYFFDDARLNVDAARGVGINAYHTVGFDAVKSMLRELGMLSET